MKIFQIIFYIHIEEERIAEERKKRKIYMNIFVYIFIEWIVEYVYAYIMCMCVYCVLYNFC